MYYNIGEYVIYDIVVGGSCEMKKISDAIVKNRKIITVIFLALIVFSVFAIPWVYVENDVAVYLADTTETKKGMFIMEDEFVTYATADIMVENVSYDEAEKICHDIENTDGVLMVGFDETEAHYKDNSALYNISFSGPAEDEAIENSYAAVKDYLSDHEYYVSSESFNPMNEVLSNEMSGVVVIVIIAVFVVLLLTSSTYAEVLVLLLTFCTAAVINMGTHFLFGTISFVSNAVAIVIQLALSVDYAIILCNRYKEEHQTKPIEESVRSALALSIPEIASSSLTTIAGLAAMTFMQFKMGLDLGIFLIKSIAISLLTVFLLMPALLMIFGKLMDKTKHKRFIPHIKFVGKFAYAARFIIPPLFIALLVFACVSFNKVNYSYTTEISKSIHQGETDIAMEKINDRFGKNHMLALLVPAGDYDAEAELIEELENCDEVNSVLGIATIDAINGYQLGQRVNYKEFMKVAEVDETTAQALFAYYAADNHEQDAMSGDLDKYEVPLVDLFLTVHDVAENGAVDLPEKQVEQIDSLYDQLQMAQDQLQGKKYSRIIIYVDLPEQSPETFAFLDQIHVMAENYYPGNDVYLTGMTVVTRDFSQTFQSDSSIVSTLSIVFVLLILFFTFKSVALPLVLIMVIQGSIWTNFSFPVWSGAYVYFMWYLIASSIQMGSNIDYAIVVSSRYTSLRANNVSKKDAIIESLDRAFPTLVSSGTMMVVAGLLIGTRVSYSIISGIGLFIGTGTLVTLALVLLALPTLLVLGDTLIQKTTISVASKIHWKNPQRALKRALSILLAAVAIATLILVPYNKNKVNAISRSTQEHCQTQLQEIAVLEELSNKFDLAKEEYDDAKMDFAEGYVTENVGRDQLKEGEEEYNKGKSELDAGEEEYADAYDKYLAGLDEYTQSKNDLDAGQAEYNAGKASYDAALKEYKAGLKKYNDGLKKYNDGKAEYEAGQKAYNEGRQQYETALSEYETARAQYDDIQPIYQAVRPIYDEYQNLIRQYDEAVASGDTATAAELEDAVNIGRLAFETSLGEYGTISELIQTVENAGDELADAEVQLEEGRKELEASEAKLAAAKAELQAGEAELADGQRTLAESEAKLAQGKQDLADGKDALDSGKAQLGAGAQELNDAKNQLSSARSELDAGKSELNAADKELNDGRQVLKDNSVKLQGSLEDLSKFSDDEEKLAKGIETLLAVPGIESTVGKHASYSEICTAAKNYYTNMSQQVDNQTHFSLLATILMIAAAVLGLATAVFVLLTRHKRLYAALGILAAICSFAGVVLWHLYCSGYAILLCVVGALCLIAVICADFIAKNARAAKEAPEQIELN